MAGRLSFYLTASGVEVSELCPQTDPGRGNVALIGRASDIPTERSVVDDWVAYTGPSLGRGLTRPRIVRQFCWVGLCPTGCRVVLRIGLVTARRPR